MAGLDKASQQARAGGKSGSKRGNDATGWKRGEGPYSSSNMGPIKMNRATDYTARGISAVSFGDPSGTADDRHFLKTWDYHTWSPHSIKQGNSPPRYQAKSNAGTSPKIQRISPSSKYARKSGGRGKGFGE